ncbi:Interleukin-17 receptor C [Liparis tanakae]|uniref:Interleukin-17 receptor C n=1 Tax=Liparis tanakae TaxID=230148 RepID=A0A4Z2J1T1_9TELE|nr:Interleukin-17 receptor C [Liparis tanakae]
MSFSLSTFHFASIQVLSDCTIKDEMPLIVAENNGVGVHNLTPYFKLCCRDGALCALCLVIDTEINFNPENDMEDEGPSGNDEEDYSEESVRNPKASVTLCYSAASGMPTCKKVEFTVNHAALTQTNWAKFSVVINKPAGVSFSSHVTVYSSTPPHLSREVVVPSLDKVCSQAQHERVEQCRVPRLSSVINQERNQVELQFAGQNKSLLSVCIQYEQNGRCQRWNRMPIPLYSVTPCTCLQVWREEELGRSLSCPFINTDFLRKNVRQNVSVSVRRGQMSDYRTLLRWNLSAPCRLEGAVWPCLRGTTCREIKGFRQQLANSTWRQDSKGQWEITGVFAEINLHLSPCVMVKFKGMGDELGPFCLKNTGRWRWSLLVVCVTMLVCLTVLVFYLLHDVIKKWVWSWRHGGLVKLGRKRHVVLLSPPDMDDRVSESVCRLGSQLCNKGFSVCVDQWSRKEQCTLGPLPWLHSQLLQLNSRGGRVVLVLTGKALERAKEWTHRNTEVIKTKGGDKELPQLCSPYSDVFTASLGLIQADKQQGRAGERFLLVTLDSLSCDRSLPELLQGLTLFQLPSHTQALLSELTEGRTGRGAGQKTWTDMTCLCGWRAKTKGGPDQQKASYSKCAEVEETWRQSV